MARNLFTRLKLILANPRKELSTLLQALLSSLHNSVKGPIGRTIHRFRHDIIVLLLLLPLLHLIAVAISHTIGALLPMIWAKLFIIFPLLLILFAGAVIFLANPVHSLLSLIAVFATTSIILLQKGQEYFAFLYLLIGIGAVATLFLFVIMLLPTARLTESYRTILLSGDGRIWDFVTSVSLVWCIYEISLPVFRRAFLEAPQPTLGGELVAQYVNTFGPSAHTFVPLYTHHFYLFLMITLILLAALVGTISTAKSTTESPITDDKKG